MASCLVTYYSIWVSFATYRWQDLNLRPLMVGAHLAFANLVGSLARGFWGWIGDVPQAMVDDHSGVHRPKCGRRQAHSSTAGQRPGGGPRSVLQPDLVVT